VELLERRFLFVIRADGVAYVSIINCSFVHRIRVALLIIKSFWGGLVKFIKILCDEECMTIEDNIKEVFKKTWDLFSNRFVVLILGTLVALVLMVFIITIPPLIFGLYILCNNLLSGKSAKVSDVFKGFEYFFRSWGLVILMALGILIGLVLLVVPGILLIIMWQYAFAVSLMENRGVVDSLGRSYDIAKRNFSFSIVFGLLLWILGTLGGATRIGVLVTVPFSILATCVAVQILEKKKAKVKTGSSSKKKSSKKK
jgi:hypothetical protein